MVAAHSASIPISRSDSAISILAVSDLHDHDVGVLLRAVQALSPDLVVIAGDGLDALARRGGAQYLSELAREARLGLAAITGNSDSRNALASCADDPRVFDLGRGPVDVGPIRFVGLPDAPTTRGVIAVGSFEYSESVARRFLARQVRGHDGPIVLVSHAPPRGLLDYSMRFGRLAGSLAVREFIESMDSRVLLTISGHVHSAGGRSVKHGTSTIWNVASPQGDPGCIGLLFVRLALEVVGEEVAPATQFGSYLSWTSAGELGFLPWMQQRLAECLVTGGITTLRQLADASDDRVGGCIGWKPEKASVWPARARAFLSGTPVVLAPLGIREGSRWYIDIETDPDGGQDFIWAVALADEAGRTTQWFLTSLRGRDGMLRSVHRALSLLPRDGLYAYSGSRFDETRLQWHFQRAGLSIPPALAEAVDIHAPLQKSIALPCSTGLKEVTRAFGIEHRWSDIDGFMAAVEARRALRNGRPPTKRLLRYNREDARALSKLVGAVARVAGTAPFVRRNPGHLSGGAQRKIADERRVNVLLSEGNVTLRELATISPYIESRMKRGLRVTSLAVEDALHRKTLELGTEKGGGVHGR